MAERPAVITPTYAMNLQGFSSEAFEYLQEMAQRYGPNSPGILYQFIWGAQRDRERISDDLDSKSS